MENEPRGRAPITTAAEAEAWLSGLIDLERTPRLRRSRISLAPIRALRMPFTLRAGRNRIDADLLRNWKPCC